MSWQDALYAQLAADATLQQQVGDRMAPLRNLQGDGYPRVTWQEVVGVPQASLTGWSGTDRVRLQVDVWDTDRLRAIAIKDRIRAVLAQPNSAFVALCLTDGDGPVLEDGLGIYRRVLEFSVWTL